ncbi:hypothetical protein D9M69_478350 [compost metagenome]
MTLKKGSLSFHWRSSMKMKSSALKSRVGLKLLLVVCHFTPLRRWKVYTVPSAEMSHFSARPGITLVPPRSNSTMVL